MRNTSQSLLSAFALLAAASASIGALTRPASASPATSTVVSTPQIQVALDPYTADGHQRIYQLVNGGTYWNTGMPIYQGDKVHVAVFVATGADDLQQLKIRLDNRPIANLTASPWSAEFDSNTLGPGPHALEAWAEVSGPKPQFVSRTLSFFVQQDKNAAVPLPSSTTPSAPTTDPNAIPGVTTKVKGGVYTLGSATQATDADIHIIPQTTAKVDLPVPSSQPLAVTGTIVIHVVPAANSQAVKFTYAISRYGNQVVQPTQELDMGSFDVRIQPRTGSTPGLLAGPATVEVWGIDAAGNHSPAQTLSIDIQPQAGS